MAGTQGASLGAGKLQPEGSAAMRAQAHMTSATRTMIGLSEKKADAPRNLGLTRDTRATVEQVCGPGTPVVRDLGRAREPSSTRFKQNPPT